MLLSPIEALISSTWTSSVISDVDLAVSIGVGVGQSGHVILGHESIQLNL